MKLNKRKENILNQEEQVYLTDFLNRLDMTYTNSGMKDVVNLVKSNGFGQYETKVNLLYITKTSQARLGILTPLLKLTPI